MILASIKICSELSEIPADALTFSKQISTFEIKLTEPGNEVM